MKRQVVAESMDFLGEGVDFVFEDFSVVHHHLVDKTALASDRPRMPPMRTGATKKARVPATRSLVLVGIFYHEEKPRRSADSA